MSVCIPTLGNILAYFPSYVGQCIRGREAALTAYQIPEDQRSIEIHS